MRSPASWSSIFHPWVARLRRKGSPEQSPSSTQSDNRGPASPPPSPNPRYKPSRILSGSGIPNVAWFEDVLAQYGSNTGVFDLYLLVADARQAADVLAGQGYTETDLKIVFPKDIRESRGGIRLEGAGEEEEEEGVVLINVAIWKYDLRLTIEGGDVPLPPLDKFLDALMACWLSITEEEYKQEFRWAMSVANLINYAYCIEGPNGDIVRAPEFAEKLLPEHRELHYDASTRYPGRVGISSSKKQRYHAIRYRQVQEGKFTPRPYPTGNFPTSLAEFPELTRMEVVLPPRRRRKKRPVDPMQSIDEAPS